LACQRLLLAAVSFHKLVIYKTYRIAGAATVKEQQGLAQRITSFNIYGGG